MWGNVTLIAIKVNFYTVIRALEDSHKLQADFDSIQNWCHAWLLKCNVWYILALLMNMFFCHNFGEHVELTGVDHELSLDQ